MAYNFRERFAGLLPGGFWPSWISQMPFTDFHQLDLDWILRAMKTVLDQMKYYFLDGGSKETIEEVMEEHPEWWPRVMDGAITKAKIDPDFLLEIENAYVTPEMFGAAGDGIADDTDAVRQALNSGKSVYLSDGSTYLIDTVIVNVSNFIINGSGIIRRKNNASDNALIRFSACHDIEVQVLNTDGNIAGNGVTVNQNQPSIRIDNGSYNINIGVINDRNPSGDTLYLSTCHDIDIIKLISASDNYTGRNAVSLINASNVNIDIIISNKTGYKNMPGGICIEPNLNTQTVKHITIGTAYIDTDGLYGFVIANATAQADIDNITVGVCYMIKKEKTENRSHGCATMFYAKHITGNFIIQQTGNDVSKLDIALHIGDLEESTIKVYGYNAQRGLYITGPLRNTKITGAFKDIYQNATQIGTTGNPDSYGNVIDINIDNFAVSGSGAAVFVGSGATAKGFTFKGDYSRKTYGQQCFRFEGIVSDIVIDGADMSNYARNNMVYGANAGSGGFMARNCKGYNYQSAQPSGYDGYTIGTVVHNTNPATGSPAAWVCTQSGKPGSWASISAN